MQPGDKVYCPQCKAHYVTATAVVSAGDSPSGRHFVYADGSPVLDADRMQCRSCGAPMYDEIDRQVCGYSSSHPKEPK